MTGGRVRFAALLAGLLLAVAILAPAGASARVGRGMLFHNGGVVRTVAVPAAIPGGGSDPLYMITDGAEGQLPIAGLGPGDAGYTGGDWAVYIITWNTTPYLLTSDEDVETAEGAGDITVTRAASMDNRCPVLP